MQPINNFLFISNFFQMKRIFIILTIFLFSNLFGQSSDFLLQIRNEYNGTNQLMISTSDSILLKEKISVDLMLDTIIEYEVRGAPIILGKSSYSEFIVNKEKLMSYYHNLVLNDVSPDYTIIYYEIETEMGDEIAVTFYYFETYQSGTLPDRISLSSGYYNLSIISNGHALKSIPIIMNNNTIIQLLN